MKTKLSKILGVVLTIAVLTSLLVVAAPVSASTLSWGAEISMTSTSTYENTLKAGMNIVDIAANGDTVFAATDVAATPLYKSTDGGVKWSGLEDTTSFPAGVTVKAVAVASDDANIVAFIRSDNEIEYSTNGGSSWTDLNSPATGAILNALDIAPGSTRYLAVGGATLGGAAELWTLKTSMAQSWTARAGTGQAATQIAINAVKYSPNYLTDKAIAVVSGNGTSSTFQLFRYESGDYEWNGSIDYMSDADSSWTGGIVLTPTTAIAGNLIAADIAFPATYLANDEGERVAFVSVAGNTSGGGVMRLTDIVQRDFQTWSGGDPGAIGSIAYNNDGNSLVAGAYSVNRVYQYTSPTATVPKASRVQSLKQPGGASGTVVALSGDTVVAGTSGDESAIALSTDDGYAFNDVALIDTAASSFDDFAISGDGGTVYVTTHDQSEAGQARDTSVWIKTKILGVTRWVRTFNAKNATVNASASYMIRVAPDDSTAVYIASAGTTNMWVSKNSGLTSWKSIPNSKVAYVQDFVVADAATAYALDGTAGQGVSKTTNSGASWGTSKEPTESLTPYSIYLAPNGDVFYSGTTGRVAFSKDAGATFSRMVDFGTGNPVIVADDAYADNNIIYVGIGTSVKRKTATTSTAPAATRGATTLPITGIGQVGGVVYVVTGNATADSSVWQSQRLTAAVSTTDAQWTSDPASGETYLGSPNSLKIALEADGDVKLFAIDTTSPALESFTDKVSAIPTTLVSPADGTSVGVNTGSGRAYDVTFIFSRYNDADIDSALLQIATDSDFDAVIVAQTWAGTIATNTIATVIGPYGAGATAEFLPGATYYWRVRTTTPINSPWSETRSFTVDSQDIPAPPFTIGDPVIGASDVGTNPVLTWATFEGAIRYQLEVSEDPSFKIIEFSHNVDSAFYAVTESLSNSTTYYWRVRGITAEPYTSRRSVVVPAGPWTTGVFTTVAAPPAAPEPTVVTITEPAPPAKVTVIEIPTTKTEVVQQSIPSWMLLTIIGIGAALVIALIVLIVRTRRVA